MLEFYNCQHGTEAQLTYVDEVNNKKPDRCSSAGADDDSK
jgi:hypothetical protein